MTTTRTTTSHANCTHEKTKAARSACRKAGTDRPPVEPKAKTAAERPEYEPSADATKGEALSGFCGTNNHTACPGAGKQWSCTCDCHAKAPAARIERYRAPSGNRDEDRFRAVCDSCDWKSPAWHSNRTIEGRTLAERDAQDHRCP